MCKVLATLGRADAPSACNGASSYAEAIEVEPDHAFARGFLAMAWTDMGEAYERMARSPAVAARDDHWVAARRLHGRSRDIWADLTARGLVSPADTGRPAAAARAYARVDRLVTAGK